MTAKAEQAFKTASPFDGPKHSAIHCLAAAHHEGAETNQAHERGGPAQTGSNAMSDAEPVPVGEVPHPANGATEDALWRLSVDSRFILAEFESSGASVEREFACMHRSGNRTQTSSQRLAMFSVSALAVPTHSRACGQGEATGVSGVKSHHFWLSTHRIPVARECAGF